MASDVDMALISSSLDIMQEKYFFMSVCTCVGARLLVFVHACMNVLNQLIHLNVWFDLFANCQFGKRDHRFYIIQYLLHKRGNQ